MFKEELFIGNKPSDHEVSGDAVLIYKLAQTVIDPDGGTIRIERSCVINSERTDDKGRVWCEVFFLGGDHETMIVAKDTLIRQRDEADAQRRAAEDASRPKKRGPLGRLLGRMRPTRSGDSQEIPKPEELEAARLQVSKEIASSAIDDATNKNVDDMRMTPELRAQLAASRRASENTVGEVVDQTKPYRQ